MPLLVPRRVVGCAILLAVSAATSHAQWTVVHLHPAGATYSIAEGMRGNQQVGQVDGLASLWNSTSASWVPLTSGRAVATDGVEQVGTTSLGAALWSGTGPSFVNLHPSVPGIIGSYATGVFAGIQVGYTLYPDFVTTHAGLWTGSAASWLDLNPPGASSSIAEGEYNGQQVGAASFPGLGWRALIWASAAASYVDLHPAGASLSYGLGVYNGQQVGRVILIGQGNYRASLWSGSAASWVDLHPPVAAESQARAVYNNLQAGWANVDGSNHASFWSGTASSWVDLHSFLGPTYSESAAYGVWTNGLGTAYVSGTAYDTVSQQYRAMLWVRNAPTTVSYCFGDGSGLACPCGNNAALHAGTGCLHSLGTGGKLVASGNASLANDTLLLLGRQMTPSSALYFQGTVQAGGGFGTLFGDGLRCAAGSVLRLGTKTNDGSGASVYPGVGSPLVSVQGQVLAPGTRYYQVWYRNAAAFCTASTFNLTNGLAVQWVP